MTLFTLLSVYIFSYFVGQADGLHLAYSTDGLRWTPLANNESILTPKVGEDKLMRDPSICQGSDGTFHMVWTSSWNDRIIGHASSKDLVNWSEQQAIPVMMHEPEARNCWAPELFYDKPTKTFWIYWATTIPGRHSGLDKTADGELNHRIYCTTTKDFKTFTPTRMFFDPGFNCIDAAVVKSDKDLIMFVKNETREPVAEKNIRIARAKKMSKGFDTNVTEPIHGDFWAEGPSPLFLEDGSLIVYYDRYMEGKYGASISHDGGSTWTEVPSQKLIMPEGMRHGTAFKITDEEFVTLLAALNKASDRGCGFVKSRIVEDGGNGEYKTAMGEVYGLEAHTVFCPRDLSEFSAEKPLPVLVWGNGACTNSPWEHFKFLNEIASHGYLVIATGFYPESETPYNGPMSTPEQQIESIDWAIKSNSDPESPFYQKIDVNNIAAAGMSCGGLQTLYNCADQRIRTVMICNSGLFIDPKVAMPGMPMPGKDQLNKIHCPIIYILGGPEDIAYVNGMDDFHRISHVPAFAANYPVGHGGTYRQPHGGEFSIPAVAWLDWQLKGCAEAAKMFQGKNCGLSQREKWTVEKNALID